MRKMEIRSETQSQLGKSSNVKRKLASRGHFLFSHSYMCTPHLCTVVVHDSSSVWNALLPSLWPNGSECVRSSPDALWMARSSLP